MIDSDGYRPNVGIILANPMGEVLWAKRIGHDSWQFPQGGIRPDEDPEEAMFRELHEELGLCSDHVEILAATDGWLSYDIPKHLQRKGQDPVCVGQKQKWYLLKFLSEDHLVNLEATASPEFDHWRWVGYWFPLCQVVDFKREVYRKALLELAPNWLPLHRNT